MSPHTRSSRASQHEQGSVERFEGEFARFVGSEHAVGVGSGLDALRLGLLALEIGPGDEVIVPANTYIATALAVSEVGAEVVLVECDPATYNVDPDAVAAAITPRTRALLPVHFTGRRRRCGRCSAWPSAMVSMLVDRLRLLRNYGERAKYDHVVKGVNSRLDGLQAAFLSVRLRHLPDWNEARLRHADAYAAELKGVGDLAFQQRSEASTHVYHLFIVETKHRDALREHLTDRGIQTGIHYPIPIHLQEAYRDLVGNDIRNRHPSAFGHRGAPLIDSW